MFISIAVVLKLFIVKLLTVLIEVNTLEHYMGNLIKRFLFKCNALAINSKSNYPLSMHDKITHDFNGLVKVDVVNLYEAQ